MHARAAPRRGLCRRSLGHAGPCRAFPSDEAAIAASPISAPLITDTESSGGVLRRSPVRFVVRLPAQRRNLTNAFRLAFETCVGARNK
ncbi:hypothetical protein E4F39_06950 [Burkholderia pseudomallei]|nr:hypothetical protein BPC006_I1935 [Burkholderia pseudomallei BPC006]MPT64714.1 hypothetical protein [Burkholderia pseudomallei]MPT71277.1 hypothetical protein [Burkholderia pseudomallei]MPT81021.1 hypothetical protein [Burkholderia pseudomallei]MPT86178.1 hypothetical protein [Burkholderia pseudomallei]